MTGCPHRCQTASAVAIRTPSESERLTAVVPRGTVSAHLRAGHQSEPVGWNRKSSVQHGRRWQQLPARRQPPTVERWVTGRRRTPAGREQLDDGDGWPGDAPRSGTAVGRPPPRTTRRARPQTPPHRRGSRPAAPSDAPRPRLPAEPNGTPKVDDTHLYLAIRQAAGGRWTGRRRRFNNRAAGSRRHHVGNCGEHWPARRAEGRRRRRRLGQAWCLVGVLRRLGGLLGSLARAGDH